MNIYVIVLSLCIICSILFSLRLLAFFSCLWYALQCLPPKFLSTEPGHRTTKVSGVLCYADRYFCVKQL